MAEERNVHTKVAMAEVLGLLMIGWITALIAFFGFKSYEDLGVILAVIPFAGWGLIVALVIAYLNENLLLTAIFGPLAFFCLAFPAIASDGLTPLLGLSGAPAAGAVALAFVGLALLIACLVSIMQPVKMLPVLLLVAAIMFFMLALWWTDLGSSTKTVFNSDWRVLVGVFAILTSLFATYMAAAISVLVVKGKPLLPLLISK